MIFIMDRTIKQEIRSVVDQYCESTEAAKNITDGVYRLLYDLPEDQVIIAKNRFRKMNTPTGTFFRFYDDDCQKWSKWIFVKK